MSIDTGEPRSEWIGPAPSPGAFAAVLLIGTIGMLICGVQPVLLGALVAEGRLSTAALGWATTAEFLALGFGIFVAGAVLKPRRLRLLVVAAALLTGAADLAMLTESGTLILVNRAISGLGEAVLVWVTGCVIARAPTPARWSGVFLTLQGLSQLAFAALMPLTLMARLGANGGFIGMAATAGVVLLAAMLIPDDLADLPAAERTSADVLASPAAILTLLSVFLIAAFSIGLFAYLAPLALQASLSAAQLGFIVSIVLGTSILGSTVAALVPKLPYYPIFIACCVLNALVLVVLWSLPGFATFAVAAGVFGFMWMFFLPYQLPMVLEVDPTRQLAVMMPGAGLIGGGAGPLICSLFVSDADARPALVVVGVCFATAFAISSVLHLSALVRRRARRAVAPLG